MSSRTRLRSALASLALPAGLALLLACATRAPDPLLGPDTALETTPLGGASLAQRKRELERAHGDLLAFHTTLESLQFRVDRNGLYLFSAFLDDYLGEHLDPLLAREWQSQHAELLGLDANVRLLEAEMLLMMRRPQQMQRVLDEIERRYADRPDLLVDYPVGHQSTLAEALEVLEQRKWTG